MNLIDLPKGYNNGIAGITVKAYPPSYIEVMWAQDYPDIDYKHKEEIKKRFLPFLYRDEYGMSSEFSIKEGKEKEFWEEFILVQEEIKKEYGIYRNG